MKKTLLAVFITVISLATFAVEIEGLDLTIPEDVLKEPKQDIKVVEKFDNNGVFYDVEFTSLAIIPADVTVAVGISSESKQYEAEVFAGLNAIRLIGASGIHIPFGARVRVALNENKTIYAEYSYQDTVAIGNQEGLFENPHTLSIIKMNKDRKNYWGCGIGQTVHHPWANESHAPENSLAPFCRFGKRF